MRILYVLSVLSFLALVWAAISITRHIRKNATQHKATRDSPDFPPAVKHRRSA